MIKTALVPVADGTEELEAVTIIDILRRAEVDVTVASVNGLSISASRGTRLTADRVINECKDSMFDLIALPGGLPGAEHLRDNAVLTAMLKDQKAAGRLYGAICASPAVVLQTHGLIGGRKATCYPGMGRDFENQEAVNETVVVDGTCVTSRGPGTAVPFALKLVELLTGTEKRNSVAKALLWE